MKRLKSRSLFVGDFFCMEKNMEFKINNTTWTIKDVDEPIINNETKTDCTLGVTIYKTQEIWLLKEQANVIKTLKHELMHVWMYEYGHNQHEKEFNFEDVCEIVASSNDFINEVVEMYKLEKGISSTSQKLKKLSNILPKTI